MKVKGLIKNRTSYENGIVFEDGTFLYSDHVRDCNEKHYLGFHDLTTEDFEGLDFDLSGDHFFERIKGYGIALKPTNGYPVRIPGYGVNSGGYSEDLTLILRSPYGETRTFDITECQEIED